MRRALVVLAAVVSPFLAWGAVTSPCAVPGEEMLITGFVLA
jgi:hypothetical protein